MISSFAGPWSDMDAIDGTCSIYPEGDHIDVFCNGCGAQNLKQTLDSTGWRYRCNSQLASEVTSLPDVALSARLARLEYQCAYCRDDVRKRKLEASSSSDDEEPEPEQSQSLPPAEQLCDEPDLSNASTVSSDISMNGELSPGLALDLTSAAAEEETRTPSPLPKSKSPVESLQPTRTSPRKKRLKVSTFRFMIL